MTFLISISQSHKNLLVQPTSKFYELTFIRKYRNGGNHQYITVNSVEELLNILSQL